MIELNIGFQEQYKQLDKLLKDVFSSAEGVSAYIRKMEITAIKKQKNVPQWDTVYKQLKHFRWMRNQLAHEISIDSDFCTQNDIDWLQQFYREILNRTDPLTAANQINESVQRHTPSSVNKKRDEKKPSLWNKIISKIKSWFSP